MAKDFKKRLAETQTNPPRVGIIQVDPAQSAKVEIPPLAIADEPTRTENPPALERKLGESLAQEIGADLPMPKPRHRDERVQFNQRLTPELMDRVHVFKNK